MDFQSILGILSGLIAISAYHPYIKSIRRKVNEPRAASWLIWAMIQLFVAISLFQAGDRNTVWLPIGMMIGNVLVAYICRRQFGRLNKLEKWCVTLAIFSIPWMLVGLPLFAIVVNIFAKTLGSLPTYQKLIANKGREDRTAWLMFSAACVCMVLSVENWTFHEALYPVCLLILNSTTTSLVIWSERRKKGAKR